ncbi:AaceriAFR534Wp [[Ashbya] aceris (nom. inval.)]|nr:AaceriAFR534Wp [[Ashbya] aceris (nom. inval.)]
MTTDEAKKARFCLQGGPSYDGYSFGAQVSVGGEVVFTTSLVGYPDSMTDPSYKGQILVFTQPLIGNYGVPDGSVRDHYGLLKYMESSKVHVLAIVVAEYAWEYSHWTAVQSLGDWCKKEGVAAIGGVDTRAVVQFLRECGSTMGRVDIEGAIAPTSAVDPSKVNLVAQVSTKSPFYLSAKNPKGKYDVALVDCGVKENILRCLVSRGVNVTVFPYDYDICSIAHHFDGVFISNGPGDPIHYRDSTVANLKRLLQHPELQQLPIFGICMGHQLLALAAGASTVKMKYGNRAHNIPALDLSTGQCHITSQNHGYAVDAATLPKDEFVPLFVNLNDKSNEGIIHVSRPIYSTQFHPEGKGGPMDCSFLFDKYVEHMRCYKKLFRREPYTRFPVVGLPSSRVL